MKKVISLSLCLLIGASSLQAGFFSNSAPVVETTRENIPYGKYALITLGVGAAAYFSYCVYKAWCAKPASPKQTPKKGATTQASSVVQGAQPSLKASEITHSGPAQMPVVAVRVENPLVAPSKVITLSAGSTVSQDVSTPVQVLAGSQLAAQPNQETQPAILEKKIIYPILLSSQSEKDAINHLRSIMNALYFTALEGKATSRLLKVINNIKSMSILTSECMGYVVAYEDAIKERKFEEASAIYEEFMVQRLHKEGLNPDDARRTLLQINNPNMFRF